MDANADNMVPHIYTMDDLAGMTAEEIIKILDTGWPWPLDAVQEWFEHLWNTLVGWFADVGNWFKNTAGSIWDTIHNWITNVWTDVSTWLSQIWSTVQTIASNTWDWVQSTGSTIVQNVGDFISSILHALQDGVNFITGHIGTYFDWIYNWLIDQFKAVAETVNKINQWFSDEFIDPFIDWLTGLPANLWAAFNTTITAIGNRLEAWLTHESPGFPGVLRNWLNIIGKGIMDGLNFLSRGFEEYMKIYDKNWLTKPAWVKWIEVVEVAVITAFGGWIIEELWPIVADFLGTVGAGILDAAPGIGAWFSAVFSRIGGWLAAAGTGIGTWLGSLLPRIAGWFMVNMVGLLGSGSILVLNATGKLETIIGDYVTPAITGVFDMFESMGPVSPAPGKSMSTGITKLATFTISGLAAMTLAGELLSPLKHIGLGHISAIIYDLINYKTLTAAFMGVLAVIYIKTPLTYYYNKVARPMIPDERGLGRLASDYKITQAEYQDFMAYHGYPDLWTEKMFEGEFRALTPYMLRSLAEGGLLDEALLDEELHHAGYRAQTIPYIKQAMRNLSVSALAAVSSSTAMSRYQEGFDDETALRSNLLALGIQDKLLDRYVFAADLKYYYDYQTDLKNYYIDLYHRREIEEAELRQNLISVGLSPERIDVYVQAQSIKRLKAAAPAPDPTLSVQESTIRERRAKNLISRDVEIQQLVTIGIELSLATAYADQDDVKLLPKVPSVEVSPLPVYKTDTGKIQVDTVRWNRRKGYIDATMELSRLIALEMPAAEAAAMTVEDTVLIAANTITKPPLALPFYQTDEGKIRVDTIRRLARSISISYEDEIAGLIELEMSASLATAIADNDSLRIKKSTTGG